MDKATNEDECTDSKTHLSTDLHESIFCNSGKQCYNCGKTCQIPDSEMRRLGRSANGSVSSDEDSTDEVKPSTSAGSSAESVPIAILANLGGIQHQINLEPGLVKKEHKDEDKPLEREHVVDEGHRLSLARAMSRRQIKAKRRKIKKRTRSMYKLNLKDCPTCKSQMINTQFLKTLKCKQHMMHLKCFTKWKLAGNTTCPCCEVLL